MNTPKPIQILATTSRGAPHESAPKSESAKPIQIFKPGKHVAMSGAALQFSETDLAATAAAYDPVKHEAPLVVGHPKHDDPAYGWVGSLSFRERAGGEGTLDVESVQVNADFAELVAAGAFKKISASFYSPDSPSNPVPGVYYLRHVGFLGAQPPAVKGLRNPSFADAEQGVVEFADGGDIQNASILRGLRDWIIGKFGLDEADKAIPGYAVQTVEREAQKEDVPETAVASAPAFVEPQPEGETMSEADRARLAALETENAALKAKETAFAEAEKKRAADARHAEHAAFAEGLVKEGKLLPAHKDVTVAGTSQWSDLTTGVSDPVNDIETAKEAVRAKIGKRANTVVMGAAVFAKLRQHPKIIDRIKYTGRDSATVELLAALFGVKRVLVGDAVYADAAGTFVDVWGRFVVAAYTDLAGAAEQGTPSYGYTYRLGGFPTVEQPYEDRNAKSWIYPVTDEVSPVIAGALGGYLISAAVA